MFDCKGIRTAEISPALVGRMSHKTRARLFGGIQSRAGYPSYGPAAGGGYLLRDGAKVKVWAGRVALTFAPDPDDFNAPNCLHVDENQGRFVRKLPAQD